VILHTQAVPGMSALCFWDYSMVSASAIQTFHKDKGMEKRDNTGISNPSKKVAGFASCV